MTSAQAKAPSGSKRQQRSPPDLDGPAGSNKARNKGKHKAKPKGKPSNPFLAPLTDQSLEADLAKYRANQSKAQKAKSPKHKQPKHQGTKPNPNVTSDSKSASKPSTKPSASDNGQPDAAAAQPKYSSNARDVLEGTLVPELQMQKPQEVNSMGLIGYPDAEAVDNLDLKQQEQEANLDHDDTSPQQQEEKDATLAIDDANPNNAQKTPRRKGMAMTRLCSALSYLSIQNRLSATSSSSSLIFRNPPSYTTRSGSRYTIKKTTWYDTNAAGFGTKPKLVANTTDTDQIDDHTFVRMAKFVEEPRCQRTLKELKINFTEKGYVLNKDLLRMQLPAFVKSIGACMARLDEQQQGTGDDGVVSLVLTHPSFDRIRNKYDQPGMTECFRAVIGSMVDRTVRLKSRKEAIGCSNPNLCGFNPLLMLQPNEYRLAYEQDVRIGTGSSYVERSRRVKLHSLVIQIFPTSTFHRQKLYGQTEVLFEDVWLDDSKVKLTIRTTKHHQTIGWVRLSGAAFTNNPLAVAKLRSIDITAVLNQAIQVKAENEILKDYCRSLKHVGYDMSKVSLVRSADRTRARIDSSVELTETTWIKEFGSDRDKRQALAKLEEKKDSDHADNDATMADHFQDSIPTDEVNHTTIYGRHYVQNVVDVILAMHKFNPTMMLPTPKWFDVKWTKTLYESKFNPRSLSRVQPLMSSTVERRDRNANKAPMAKSDCYIAQYKGIPPSLLEGKLLTEFGEVTIELYKLSPAMQVMTMLPACTYCYELSHSVNHCLAARSDAGRHGSGRRIANRRCARCNRAHYGVCTASHPTCGRCAGRHYTSTDNLSCSIIVSYHRFIDQTLASWKRMLNLDGLGAGQIMDMDLETLTVPCAASEQTMELDTEPPPMEPMEPIMPPKKAKSQLKRPKRNNNSSRNPNARSLSQGQNSRSRGRIDASGNFRRRKPQAAEDGRRDSRSRSRSRSGNRRTKSSEVEDRRKRKHRKKKVIQVPTKQDKDER